MYVKVLSKDLNSAIIKTDLQVQYSVGEWAVANPKVFKKGYGLCVFTNQSAATNFAFNTEDYRFFEVEVENVLPELPALGCFLNIKIGNILDNNFEEDGLWPFGTIMVEKVKLVREIFLD